VMAALLSSWSRVGNDGKPPIPRDAREAAGTAESGWGMVHAETRAGLNLHS
jgi:hypothetical protein